MNADKVIKCLVYVLVIIISFEAAYFAKRFILK